MVTGMPTGVVISCGPWIPGSGKTLVRKLVVSLHPKVMPVRRVTVRLPGVSFAVGFWTSEVCPLPKFQAHLTVSIAGSGAVRFPWKVTGPAQYGLVTVMTGCGVWLTLIVSVYVSVQPLE